MQKLVSGFFYVLCIILMCVALVYARDYFRILEVRRGIEYAESYKKDSGNYPSEKIFFTEFAGWNNCNTYCYATDGQYYRIVYHLNKYMPVPNAPGTAVFTEGNRTGIFNVRSCEITHTDCPDPNMYY